MVCDLSDGNSFVCINRVFSFHRLFVRWHFNASLKRLIKCKTVCSLRCVVYFFLCSRVVVEGSHTYPMYGVKWVWAWTWFFRVGIYRNIEIFCVREYIVSRFLERCDFICGWCVRVFFARLFYSLISLISMDVRINSIAHAFQCIWMLFQKIGCLLRSIQFQFGIPQK